MRKPETDARFAAFFSRPWADTLALSYRNFLAAVFEALPMPALARVGAERAAHRETLAGLEAARSQVRKLEAQLAGGLPTPPTPATPRPGHAGLDAAPTPGELIGLTLPPSAREADGARIGGLLRSGSATPQPPPPAEDEPPSRRRRCASDAYPSLPLAASAAFSGHSAPLTCARFSPDGGCVASASSDGTVRLWEPRPTGGSSSGERAATLYCGGPLAACEWEPRAAKLLLLAGCGGTLRAWSTESKRVVCDAPAQPGAGRVRSLRVSPADASFAVVQGPALSVYSLRSFQPQFRLPLPERTRAAAVAYNHNGRMLAAACADGTVRLFDLQGQRPQIAAWAAHEATAPATALAFGIDQTSVFSLGSDGMLAEWSLRSQAGPLRSIDVSAFCGPLAGLYTDDDGSSGSGEDTPAAPVASDQRIEQRHDLVLQPAGRWALLTGAGSCAAAVDLSHPEGKVYALRGHTSRVTCVDWHPTGRDQCLTGGGDSAVRLATLE